MGGKGGARSWIGGGASKAVSVKVTPGLPSDALQPPQLTCVLLPHFPTQIAAMPSPEEAARLGRRMERSRPNLLRPDWADVKVQVMLAGLQVRKEGTFMSQPAVASWMTFVNFLRCLNLTCCCKNPPCSIYRQNFQQTRVLAPFCCRLAATSWLNPPPLSLTWGSQVCTPVA